jgi:hypothetical protein
MEGAAYLEEFIRDKLIELGRRGGGRDLEDKMELAALSMGNAALIAEALVSVEALERALAEGMLEGFRARLLQEGLIPENAAPMGPLGAGEEVGPFYWGPITNQPPVELVRVIPVGRDVGVFDDTQIVVVAAEIWTDHTAVRTTSQLVEGTQREPSLRWMLQLEDDTGRLYHLAAGQTGGSGGSWVADHEFRPAPSPEASALTLIGRWLMPIPPSQPREERPMVPAWGFPREEIFRLEIPLN